MSAKTPPQAFLSEYAPRLRTYNNSLLSPVVNNAPAGPIARTTKRGTTMINYAEDGYDDYDDDDDDMRRRPTGLRSLRRDDSASKAVDPSDKVGKDTFEPVGVQGIWRDWMGKTRQPRSDMQNYTQACLPLTLIPIRIDVDVPAYTPQPPLPLANGHYDPSNPMFKAQEQTLPYKLKDIFLWNLHETLITTDQFALTLVQDLDLPNRGQMVAEISKQIRTQLEEYAGVALHPLFHSQHQNHAADMPKLHATVSRDDPATPAPLGTSLSRADTPNRNRNLSATPSKPGPSTPVPVPVAQVQPAPPDVTATASPIPTDSDEYNPDDTYRCIVTLNINLSSSLYTDKFEWSLLHPPGTAEAFAKLTCADLGLAGEWVPAMTHAIYEAVLRLKKEACEAGGLVSGTGAAGDFPNDAAIAASGESAGWRYDPENLASNWEPKIEILSKEEIEKREGDRERQIRRLRRETARFSSNTGMVGGVPIGFGFGGLIEQEEERMGRGERSKKKKRFRSLSPLARSGTPGGRGTPDVGGVVPGGGYGGGGSLTDQERPSWRCTHCQVWGTGVWAVRDGPYGPRVSSPFPLRYPSDAPPPQTCLLTTS